MVAEAPPRGIRLIAPTELGGARWKARRGLDPDRAFVVGLAVVFGGLLVLFVGWPMLTVLIQSVTTRSGGFGFDNYARIFAQAKFWTTVKNSFAVSATVTVITIALAFPYAYALTRTAIPLKGFWRAVMALPVFAPSLVQALGLIFLFGRNGLISRQLGIELHIYGFWGIVIADVIYAFPQAVLLLSASLATADARPYEAATVLGAGPVRTFFDVTLPSVKYGVMSAAFLVFTIAITDFGNPVVIGGDYTVLANEIYNQVSGQMNFNLGAVVAIVLLIPAAVSFWIERIANERQLATVGDRSQPLAPKRAPARDAALLALVGTVAAVIALVTGIVVFASFVKTWPYNLTFTLGNYLNNTAQNGLDSLWNSIRVSAMAALIGTVLALGAAYLAHVDRGPAGRFAQALGVLPAAVPGMVLGIAYVFAFNSPRSPVNAIYDTLLMLALCNVYHYHAQAMMMVATSLRQISRSFDEASRCLGGRRVDTLRHVLVPLIAPTLAAVAVFLFMRSMVTLSAVIFLVSPGTNLASVTVMLLEDAGTSTQAAAYSTLIMAVVLAAWGCFHLGRRVMAKRAGPPRRPAEPALS